MVLCWLTESQEQDEKRTPIILWTERPTGAVIGDWFTLRIWPHVSKEGMTAFDSCGVALIPVEFCRRIICILVVYKNVESSSSRRHQIFDTGASSTSDLSSFSSSGCFFGFFGFPLEDQCRFSCLFFITTRIITIIFAWRQRLSSNNLHEECGIEKSMSCKP